MANGNVITSYSIHYTKLYDMNTRREASDYLKQNCKMWPGYIERYIAPKEFKTWRFVQALDGEIVFANCIEPCITEEEWRKL